MLGVGRGGKYEVIPIDINAIVSASADMFGRTRKEIHIHKKLHESPLAVMADKIQIEQVLLNMYINAWQAMPRAGDLYLETTTITPEASICEVHSVIPGEYAKIAITDTGTGMDTEKPGK